eukprot:c10689_g1_i2.p1 GENE.c10689_g1_i2~~c10689_g1_i2.p1  ORF type:complete len:128 (+),score=48.59 c10689_g1_i2:60-386(+)
MSNKGGSQSIERLLIAEKDASDLVSRARTERQAKLKEAHDAAAVEIKKYKQEREDQLNGYKQQALAGQGEHEVDLKKKTEIEIQQSQVQAESRKHDVIVMLVKAVTSV